MSSIDGLANVHDIQVTTQDCQWKCHAPSLYNIPSNMTVLYHGHGMHISFARKACYAWDGARIVFSRVNAARWRRSCIPNRCKYIWYISWGRLLARGLLVLFDTFITLFYYYVFVGLLSSIPCVPWTGQRAWPDCLPGILLHLGDIILHSLNYTYAWAIPVPLERSSTRSLGPTPPPTRTICMATTCMDVFLVLTYQPPHPPLHLYCTLCS